MSKLTLDEAIKHCLEVAEEQSRLYSLCPCPCDGTKNCMSLENGKDMGCTKCAADHRQLAEWLTNYKEAMRLLKSAIDEWHIVCEWGKCGEYCGWYVNGQCTQRWSGEAEALKLIES